MKNHLKILGACSGITFNALFIRYFWFMSQGKTIVAYEPNTYVALGEMVLCLFSLIGLLLYIKEFDVKCFQKNR